MIWLSYLFEQNLVLFQILQFYNYRYIRDLVRGKNTVESEGNMNGGRRGHGGDDGSASAVGFHEFRVTGSE